MVNMARIGHIGSVRSVFLREHFSEKVV